MSYSMLSACTFIQTMSKWTPRNKLIMSIIFIFYIIYKKQRRIDRSRDRQRQTDTGERERERERERFKN